MLSLLMMVVTLRERTCEACCSCTTANLVATFVPVANQCFAIRFPESFAGCEWSAVYCAATAACSPAAFLLPPFLVSMVVV
jgi:hypothetical protein